MKKLYMRTVIDSFGRDCFDYLFQLYDSKVELPEGNLFWLGQCYPPSTFHIGRRTNPILTQLNTILKQPI